MVIPNSVKIDGRMVPVETYNEGVVTVGMTKEEMDSDIKERINAMDYNLHFIPWGEQMFNLYESAYKIEKKRLMG